MGMYDQLLSINQQGLDNLSRTAQIGAQQPTMADVFMDRFRQGGQDRLAQQKAAEQTRMNEATMRNMEAQRLIQGAQMMSLYGNEANAPMMQAVGAKIGMPEVPAVAGLKDRELGVKVDQFDKGLASKEKIASESNDTKALIASWSKDKKEKPIKLVQVLQHIANGDIPPEMQQEALKWATYTPPATPMSAPIAAVKSDTGESVLLQPKKEGGVVPVEGYAPLPKSGVGRKPVDQKKVNQILDEIEKVIPQTSGGAVGGALNWVKGQANISDETTKANTKISAAGASLMMNMPRMEGPQSDRDVALYREQIGKLNSPTTPIGDKKAAVQVIRALHKQYASQNQTEQKPSSRVGQKTKMADGEYSDGKTTVTVKDGKIVSEK